MEGTNGQDGRRGPVRLRPYQQDAIARLRARVRAGVRRLIIVAPTGSGKTTIAAHVIAGAVSRGSRVLFMAHRRELIHQAYGRLIDLGVPEASLGVLMGRDPRWRPGAPVQVASVDTLRHRARPLADIVFVDECHRATAKTYRDIADGYPDALHLGLTATPFRASGGGLGDVYDELLVVASPQELIDQGYLVAPRVFTVPEDDLPDLSGVRTRQGDYEPGALEAAVNRRGLVGNLVDHWMRHAKGVRTVAFAVSVAHSKHIAARFQEAGVAAEHLDGATPLAERDAILRRLDAGEITVVSNAMVLAEGWDQPAVKCAILARPTKSLGLYLQQAGRILRPWNGQQAIILDHGGCVLRHGLPQDERELSLEGARRSEPGEAPVRVCPECHAVVPLGSRTCRECGAVLIPERDVPREKEGTLVEVESDDVKRRELARLQAIAEICGYKPGWVYHRYRERFGEAPPRTSRGGGSAAARQRALRDVLRQAARSGGALDWSAVDAALRRGGPSRWPS